MRWRHSVRITILIFKFRTIARDRTLQVGDMLLVMALKLGSNAEIDVNAVGFPGMTDQGPGDRQSPVHVTADIGRHGPTRTTI